MMPYLTKQQKDLRSLGVLDLSSGYPILTYSAAISEQLAAAAQQLSSHIAVPSTVERYKNARSHEDCLEALLRRQLRMRTRPTFTSFVSSGSLAIERSINGLRQYALATGRGGLELIFPSPTFDLPRLICDDLGVPYRFLPCSIGVPSDHLIEQIEAHLEGGDHEAVKVLWLTSPSNPCGRILSRDELDLVKKICSRLKVILFVDHCFAMAGVQDIRDVNLIWENSEVDCDWISLWDTGKTFGLSGLKFALLCSNSFRLKAYLQNSLDCLQYEHSFFCIEFFKELFSGDLWIAMVEELREKVLRNLNFLLTSSIEPWRVLAPEGGTFALLQSDPETVSARSTQQHLSRSGVGVVSGHSFFNPIAPADNFLRISLGRSESEFIGAIEILKKQIRIPTT